MSRAHEKLEQNSLDGVSVHQVFKVVLQKTLKLDAERLIRFLFLLLSIELSEFVNSLV